MTPCRKHGLAALALALGCALPITTSAQNRVIHGGFGQSLAGWSIDSADGGSAVHREAREVGASTVGPTIPELRRWTIDSGAGTASGGTLVLSGSIGQADAGSAAGGTIELQGGFWFAADGSDPGASIFRNGFESP